MSFMTSKQVGAFRREVWNYWKKNGRHDLAWRKTRDPYKILVSEVMLQQTQVSRVEGKYGEFLKEFPNVRALAKAPLAEVLKVWSGLGFNRRAKFFPQGGKDFVPKHAGNMPRDIDALLALPGVGEYTAKAVRVFAFNEPEILIETNIRTVFFHYFYSSVLQNTRIRDEKIVPLARAAAKGQSPREWHWALMDHGTHLKASGVRVNARSKHYTKQSKFEGSLRQVRGVILKAHTGKESLKMVRETYKDAYDKAFASLLKDGLISV